MNTPPCKIALGEVNRANSACSSRGLMANYPTRRQRMQHKHGHSGETPGGTAPASGGRRRAPCLPEFGCLCCHEVRGYRRFMCFAFIFAEQRSCFVCQKWSFLGGWRGEEAVWVFARTLWPSVWLVVFFFLSLCNQGQCSVSVIANLLRTLLGFFFLVVVVVVFLNAGLNSNSALPLLDRNRKKSAAKILSTFDSTVVFACEWSICHLLPGLGANIHYYSDCWKGGVGEVQKGKKQRCEVNSNDLVRQPACYRTGFEVRQIHLERIQR